MGGSKTRSHKRRRLPTEAALAAKAAAAVEAAETPEPAAYVRPGESESGAAFELYYRAQRILPDGSNDDEDAWSAFLGQLRRPLPVTFRFNESAHLSTLCAEAMRTGMRLLDPCGAGVEVPCDESGRPLRMPVRLRWCNGWQLGCSASILKRPQHAYWSELNDWLTRWAALGVLSRQAIDSMAPVSLLNVAPHHTVLDLCASPGSKTQQLLDAMHADPATAPTGLVVANDFSPFRARMLVRRCAALGRAAARCVVVTHAAQHFPDVSGRVGSHGEGAYDRIVCDVPCCGTLEPPPTHTHTINPEAPPHWRPSFAQRLHGLQICIALRGIALLRVGGEMAFSTCA
ncbi:S-adenosyl-L-methionine-dependent methyltransferase, partial [Pavlovales sp. CCMP2436]